MKKVGIITHYYNSSNYGGVLQAYALCYVLNRYGINAEQICYDRSIKSRSFIRKILHCVRKIYSFLVKACHLSSSMKIGTRKKKIYSFRNSIKHSDTIYSDLNIELSNDIYDAFISGSDQVWNPRGFTRGYSLSFSTKPVYAFAASIAADAIPDEVFLDYERILPKYSLVSVRERRAIEEIEEFCNPVLVLDPVFLLSKEDWCNIASSRMISEKYIFAYFLGNSEASRREVEKIAKQASFKVVSIPFLNDEYRKCDVDFGDYQLSNVSPNDFLSLINHSECVFTDSFHAICFSYILHKDFYVFERQGGEHMNSRISDILITLGLKDRYVTNLNEMEPIDYSVVSQEFVQVRNQTNDFLAKMIDDINRL